MMTTLHGLVTISEFLQALTLLIRASELSWIRQCAHKPSRSDADTATVINS